MWEETFYLLITTSIVAACLKTKNMTHKSYHVTFGICQM
jgi:hypothetical protein